MNQQQASLPCPLSKKAAPEDTTAQYALRMGLSAAVPALGLRWLQELASPKPNIYDPKKILKKLRGVSAVSPSGPDLDIPYPVLKTPPAGAGIKVGFDLGSFVNNITPPKDDLLHRTLGMGSIIGGLAGGYGLGSGVINALAPKPQDPKKDSEFLQKELEKARAEYRKTLLQRQVNKTMGSIKLSEDLNALAEKALEKQALLPLLAGLGATAVGGKALTDSWNPIDWAKGLGSAAQSAHDTGSMAVNAAKWGVPAALVAGGMLAPYAYSSEKERLNKEDPLPKVDDVDEDIAKAIKLRSRAIAAGRGLPPINVRPRPVEVNPAPLIENQQLREREKMSKVASFVDNLFAE